MRVLTIALMLLSLAFHSSRASADETEGAASKRQKEMLAMQLEFSRIAGMNTIVEHLASRALQCETVQDCTSMPMGSRACGGPTSFVITSRMNPSLEAVTTSVAMVTQAEKDANLKFRVMSICSIEMPPAVSCNDSVCEAR